MICARWKYRSNDFISFLHNMWSTVCR